MMLPPEASFNVNSSSAMQDLIDAAVRLVDALPGTFPEREQALLGALQEAGRVGVEYDLQRNEQALPDDIAVGSERRPYLLFGAVAGIVRRHLPPGQQRRQTGPLRSPRFLAPVDTAIS